MRANLRGGSLAHGDGKLEKKQIFKELDKNCKVYQKITKICNNKILKTIPWPRIYFQWPIIKP